VAELLLCLLTGVGVALVCKKNSYIGRAGVALLLFFLSIYTVAQYEKNQEER